MKWIALCNGGPNNTTVGSECTSLGKAIGSLEAMMKNLGASLGQIQQISDQKTLDRGKFVETEQEAGKEEEE